MIPRTRANTKALFTFSKGDAALKLTTVTIRLLICLYELLNSEAATKDDVLCLSEVNFKITSPYLRCNFLSSVFNTAKSQEISISVFASFDKYHTRGLNQ
ncbi:hypothetical protein CHCC14437_4365 [Bacillus licheniformis]|nr:hypothetical protein CHCC14437_4365 [Bacillus licheniformis]